MDSMSDMDGMSNSTVMMVSVFQTSMATPLYSSAWTPASTGGYAATCIFLIILAMLLRGLLATKAWAESRWLDAELRRRYIVVAGRAPLAQRLSQEELTKRMTLSENGVEEEVMVVKKKHTHVRPWRLTVDPLRALLDMVIAGVAYLL